MFDFHLLHRRLMWILCVLLSAVAASAGDFDPVSTGMQDLQKQEEAIRFATFNVSFYRKAGGELEQELTKPDALNPRRIAEIIQRVRPDVLLLNEFDYDAEGQGVAHFLENYLGVSQNQQQPIRYEHVYFAPVNTGVDSGFDLNKDGQLGTANDAFGFGVYPGQYGMVVLSKFEIERDRVRSFQKFLWKDMPGNLWPTDPQSGDFYYTEEIKRSFRLSSKSHWDVPIRIGSQTIHFLTAHPTPPVFDGEEDRNGRRNHDEIRLFADYVTNGKSDYLYDDAGKQGGLPAGARFVIAGDMNADEFDGDSTNRAAEMLTKHPLINHAMPPSSEGGVYYAESQGQANLKHEGNPAFDTGDFSDSKIGNLRIDYCLPSKNLDVVGSGVFWPKPEQPGSELVKATDHRMVWVDLKLESDSNRADK